MLVVVLIMIRVLFMSGVIVFLTVVYIYMFVAYIMIPWQHVLSCMNMASCWFIMMVPTTLFKSVPSSRHEQSVPTCMNKPVNNHIQVGQLNHVQTLSIGKNKPCVFTWQCIIANNHASISISPEGLCGLRQMRKSVRILYRGTLN